MPRVRGKFRVIEITQWNWNRRSAQVKLESVQDTIDASDELELSTSSASISMLITNPASIDHFPLGKEFVLDFTPIDE